MHRKLSCGSGTAELSGNVGLVEDHSGFRGADSTMPLKTVSISRSCARRSSVVVSRRVASSSSSMYVGKPYGTASTCCDKAV